MPLEYSIHRVFEGIHHLLNVFLVRCAVFSFVLLAARVAGRWECCDQGSTF